MVVGPRALRAVDLPALHRDYPGIPVVAFGTFRKYVEQVEGLVGSVGRSEEANVLRVAQASWAMLHGLVRLRIDGIYVDTGNLDAMADEAVRFLLGRLRLLERTAP